MKAILNSQKISRLIVSTKHQKSNAEEFKESEVTVYVSGILKVNEERYKACLIEEKNLDQQVSGLKLQRNLLEKMNLADKPKRVQENTLQKIDEYKQEIAKIEVNLVAVKQQKHSLRINLAQNEKFFKYLDSSSVVSSSHAPDLITESTSSSSSSQAASNSNDPSKNPFSGKHPRESGNKVTDLGVDTSADKKKSDSLPAKKRGSIISGPEMVVIKNPKNALPKSSTAESQDYESEKEDNSDESHPTTPKPGGFSSAS